MQGQWIQHPQQNKTVIFIHGILSSSESCWTNKNGTVWFNLLKEETELDDLGIYTFSYNTSIFSGTYSLNDVVTALKEHLKLDKVLQPDKQLIFVCHSMGGIVVRKFIVERQTDLINLNLQIGLFLVASPSLGSGYANLISAFAKILNHTQADALRFSQNNIWLNGLDSEFINFKEAKHLPLIGKELIEDKPIVLKKFLKKQIVEPFAGARYFGEHFKVPNSDHSSIAKPENKQAIQHRLLCEFIKEFDITIENNFPKQTESNNTIETKSINQTVTHSTADNIVCAEQIIDSFKTEIHHHHYLQSESKPLGLDSTPEIDLYHLPEPTTALIGRKTELAQLTEAIKNPSKRLAIIVAAGGIGKSALTDEWLTQIAEQNYYGKTRVFGWSFYSQDSHNTFTNSQPFFSAVLPFLGIHDIPKDEIEKARLLARECQKQPCLLILDGLEPLQYAENLPSMNGELQDSALKEFILQFRRAAGQSFVLLSSRQPLVELKKWQDEHFLSLPLATLPHSDGAKLLAKLGVQGSDTERQAISQELNGHALSLVLFGHLLVEHHAGDPRYANELPPLTSAHGNSDAEKDSRHALRVLDYYDSLQDAASRCFLQLLGLFDRPMNAAEKAVLIANANHAEPLRALTLDWKKLEQQLENSGLLLGKKGTFERLEWDTHPIIRAYFGEKFKEKHPEEFKQAHLVLFDYYQKLPEKEFPDTLEEMLPLYRAVVHGCLAGEYQQALHKVYRKRGIHYRSHQLGAYSQELTVLAAFFPSGWWDESVEIGLSEDDHAQLFADTSFCLMSLGRLEEAFSLRLNDFKFFEKTKDYENATNSVQKYVEISLPLGILDFARKCAELAKTYAHLNFSKSQRKPFEHIEYVISQSYLATVLHRKGNLSEALQQFQEAEREFYCGRAYQYLSALSGFFYCALLLDIANDKAALQAVRTRAENSLEERFKPQDGFIIALDYLILARVHVALDECQQAETIFQQALQNIQKSGKLEWIPPFYLYHANFYLSQNQLNKAELDLNSAREIIEPRHMKLYAVDYLLIHGRYSLATADVDTALDHYKEAKQLIDETGYHLRDAELDLFAAQICLNSESKVATLDSKDANYYLQKAKNRIEEIGQWGLMRVIERDFPNDT